ncbi:MAG: hypothetical protein ACE5LG_09515 [Anaerolineae bacterium]
MSRNLVAGSLLLSLLLLAGCVASPQEPPTPTAPAYIGQVYEGGTWGYIWNLTDIRCEVRPDRVRLILEMEGMEGGEEGIPPFQLVEVYNDQVLFPVAPDQEAYDPSWGEARIDVTIINLYAYDYPLNEKLPIVLPDNPLVTKIGLYPTYDDAMLGFSIGLKRAASYEVSTLESPARIVIEVLE